MGTECLRWTAYSSSISASVLQFWKDELFTDVTLAVPGGAVMVAHRAVLAARSAGLRRLLLAAAAEAAPLLLLRGVTAGQLRLLLQLLYTGRVQAERQQLDELLELCRDLEVEGLDEDTLCPLEGAHPSSAEVVEAAPPVDTPPEGRRGLAAAAAAAEEKCTNWPADWPADWPEADESASRLEWCGLPAGGGACWLPSAPPPPAGPPRPCTPVTDRVDSEDDTAPAGSPSPPLTPSMAGIRGGGLRRRAGRESACDDSGSATFRHVSSLLEALDRRELLQLRRRAEGIMYPDYTAWLPDEIMVKILSHLSPRELLLAAGTCRRWHALSEDDSVWRHCLRARTVGSDDTQRASRQFCMSWLGWTEQRLAPPKRLKGHESVIRCMAVDGDRIVTGSSDKTIGIWSAASGQLTCRIRGSEVTCVQVEGDTVVAAARDRTLGVWDAASGRRLHRLEGHGGAVWSLALHGDRVASGSDDKTVRLWDVRSGHQEAVLRSHQTVVRAVCFDGRWVVSGDDAGCVQVWNAASRAVETVWQARSRNVMVLQHGCGVVVSGHGDGVVNVWDMGSRQLCYELRAHSGWVTDICMCNDLLLTGCKDGTALLWRLTTGGLLHRLCGPAGHRQRVTAVRLLPGLAVTGSRDGRVKLWELASGALLRDLVTPDVSGGPVKHVWAGPDRLVCGVQCNASDRPQVLVFEMALRRGGDGR